MPLKSLKARRGDDGLSVQEDSFPSVHLDMGQMEVLNVDALGVGDTAILVARVRLTSMSMGENPFDNRATLDLVEGDLEIPQSEDDRAERIFGRKE